MTVPVVLNAFDFFLDFVEECDILTWNTAAAKIAEKKHNFGTVALPKSLVCHLNYLYKQASMTKYSNQMEKF